MTNQSLKKSVLNFIFMLSAVYGPGPVRFNLNEATVAALRALVVRTDNARIDNFSSFCETLNKHFPTERFNNSIVKLQNAYCLVNGKPVTHDNIQSMLEEIRDPKSTIEVEKHPHRLRFTLRMEPIIEYCIITFDFQDQNDEAEKSFVRNSNGLDGKNGAFNPQYLRNMFAYYDIVSPQAHCITEIMFCKSKGEGQGEEMPVLIARPPNEHAGKYTLPSNALNEIMSNGLDEFIASKSTGPHGSQVGQWQFIQTTDESITE